MIDRPTHKEEHQFENPPKEWHQPDHYVQEMSQSRYENCCQNEKYVTYQATK